MRVAHLLLTVVVLGIPLLVSAQARITGRVEISHMLHGKNSRGNAEVVVQLVPLDGQMQPSSMVGHFRLAQKNKSFEKHLLVIPVGSVVDFPNLDPIFHNVFSMFEGQRFDLGLYESGSTRSVKFAKPGVSYIFCNIHPQMEAVVVASATPWFAVTNNDGEFSIQNVPLGHYEVKYWFEQAATDELSKTHRTVAVEGDIKLPTVVIREITAVPAQHKNKYGRDYDVTDPNSPYLPGQ